MAHGADVQVDEAEPWVAADPTEALGAEVATEARRGETDDTKVERLPVNMTASEGNAVPLAMQPHVHGEASKR